MFIFKFGTSETQVTWLEHISVTKFKEQLPNQFSKITTVIPTPIFSRYVSFIEQILFRIIGFAGGLFWLNIIERIRIFYFSPSNKYYEYFGSIGLSCHTFRNSRCTKYRFFSLSDYSHLLPTNFKGSEGQNLVGFLNERKLTSLFFFKKQLKY